MKTYKVIELIDKHINDVERPFCDAIEREDVVNNSLGPKGENVQFYARYKDGELKYCEELKVNGEYLSEDGEKEVLEYLNDKLDVTSYTPSYVSAEENLDFKNSWQ